jgi:hypothetical protein
MLQRTNATTNSFYEYNQDATTKTDATTNAMDLKEVFSCWNKLSKLMKDCHPDIAAVEMGLNHFNDTLLAHFWRVKKSRIKQSTLDSFFQKSGQTPSN